MADVAKDVAANPVSVVEFGRLLYEPEWANKRIRNWDYIFMGVSFIILSFFIIEPGLSLISIGSTIDKVLVPATYLLFVTFGLFLIFIEIKQMPFRVYENGFTEVYVSIIDGLMRQERLVHRSRIKEVTSASGRGILKPRHFTITYSRSGSREKTLRLTKEVVDDKVEALRALMRIAPNAVDETVESFIGRKDSR